METQLVHIHSSRGFSRRTALCAAAGLAVSAIVGRAWTTEPSGIVPVEEIWRRIRRIRYGGFDWLSKEAAMRSRSLSATEGVGQGGNLVATAVQQAVRQYARSFQNFPHASEWTIAIGGRNWPFIKSTEWDIDWDSVTESMKRFSNQTHPSALMFVDDQQSREIVATLIVAR